ncbi:MAG: hypothetical protein C0P79_008195 [Gammaproteobacteria bacterium]
MSLESLRVKRTLAAALVTALAAGAVAWWVKGDLEMAWLLWMPVLPAAGAVIGLVAALALRAPIHVSATVIGPTAGVLALWAAIATPHAWDAPGRASAERTAASLAADVARIEALARERLDAGVDVAGARPDVRGGRVRKESMRFFPMHDPLVAELRVDFALGPASGLVLRVEGDSLGAEPAALDAARAAPWRIGDAALRRRFDARALRLGTGGASAWAPGTVLPLRIERAADDWTLLVVRVGGPDGLAVVREIPRDESRAALAEAAARAGREVRDVVIYFTERYGGVTFEPGATFDFIGLPVDGGGPLRLVARFEGGEYVYETSSGSEDR